jgi:hypothetical protein
VDDGIRLGRTGLTSGRLGRGMEKPVGCVRGKLAGLDGPMGHGPLEQTGGEKEKRKEKKGKRSGLPRGFRPKRI